MIKPKLQSVDGLQQLRYMLPYNLHVSCVYPLLAPNGSTVIVCGHDHGVYVVWRGGRPFKASQIPLKTKARINGNGIADGMAFDDNDEDGPQVNTSNFDESVFEEEEEELDPAKPYRPIIQDLDLSLGTAVLHLALPRLPGSPQPVEGELSPSILEHNLVVALVCADTTIKVLALPLMPPTPQMKSRQELRTNVLLGDAGHGSWNEQLIKIPSASDHHSLPKAISIAFIPRSMVASMKDAVDGDEEQDQSRNDMIDDDSDDMWDLLVAHVGSDQPSEFAIHKIRMSADGQYFDSDSVDKGPVWRTEPLINPVVAVDLSVSTKFEDKEGPYMLLAEANGVVRIYDCCALTGKRHGSWLRCLYPGFETASDGRVRYRAVLDAKWVLHGQAIGVLTANGEWGVWNISFQRIEKPNNARHGKLITGEIPTKFSLSGWVGRSTITNLTKSSSSKPGVRSKLAPMTPVTRKVRQEALFTGIAPGANKSASGGIVVRAVETALDDKQEDETILLWHADKITIIPSLLAHWQNKIQGSGNIFNNGANGQTRDISTIDIGGEMRSSVSIFPDRTTFSRTPRTLKHSDVLVSGDRSLVIQSTPITEHTRTAIRRQDLLSPSLEDQQLLAQGALDVSGMDRILDSMSNGTQSKGLQASSITAKRKVGFLS